MGRVASAAAIALLVAVVAAAVAVQGFAQVVTATVIPSGKLVLQLNQYASSPIVSSVSKVYSSSNVTVFYTGFQIPIGAVNGAPADEALFNASAKPVDTVVVKGEVINVTQFVNAIMYVLSHGYVTYNATNESAVSLCISTIRSPVLSLIAARVGGVLHGIATVVAMCNVSSTQLGSIALSTPAILEGSKIVLLWGASPLGAPELTSLKIVSGFAPATPILIVKMINLVHGLASDYIEPVVIESFNGSGGSYYMVIANNASNPSIGVDYRLLIADGSYAIAASIMNTSASTASPSPTAYEAPGEAFIYIHKGFVEAMALQPVQINYLGVLYNVYVASCGNVAMVALRSLLGEENSVVWLVGKNLDSVPLSYIVSAALPGATAAPKILSEQQTYYAGNLSGCTSIALESGNVVVCHFNYTRFGTIDVNVTSETAPLGLPTATLLHPPIYGAAFTSQGVRIYPITKTVTSTEVPSSILALAKASMISLLLLVAAVIIGVLLLFARKGSITRY